MNIDLAQLRTLLRINGVTEQGSDDQIRTVLQQSGYTPDQQSAALQMLRGGPIPTPQVQAPFTTAPSAEIVIPKKRSFWSTAFIVIGALFVLLLLSPFVLAFMAHLHSPSQTQNYQIQHAVTSSASETAVSDNGALRIPVMTYPMGWREVFNKVDNTYGLIDYVSPTMYLHNPSAKIEVVIKGPTNTIARLGSVQHDQSINGVQNFSQRMVAISGVAAQEDEYDVVNTYGQTTIATHNENIYFSDRGYEYAINAMYYKASGDSYLSAIHSALDSATLK